MHKTGFLVRTAKLVLEEYFSLGDTVNDMNKILLKDSRPSRTSFQLGPPAPVTPPVQPPEEGLGQARLTTLNTGNTQHRSAFEVSEAPHHVSLVQIYIHMYMMTIFLVLRFGMIHKTYY